MLFFPCGLRQENNIAEDDITALNKFGETVYVAGQRKDWVHHGVELGAVASIRLQLQGGRILVMAKLDEIQSFLMRSEMSDAKLDIAACGGIVVSFF